MDKKELDALFASGDIKLTTNPTYPPHALSALDSSAYDAILDQRSKPPAVVAQSSEEMEKRRPFIEAEAAQEIVDEIQRQRVITDNPVSMITSPYPSPDVRALVAAAFKLQGKTFISYPARGSRWEARVEYLEETKETKETKP